MNLNLSTRACRYTYGNSKLYHKVLDSLKKYNLLTFWLFKDHLTAKYINIKSSIQVIVFFKPKS